ncbi:CaiB/BaiF CoA transferase family protein [Mesorhizobium sp. 1B3]|uniref:CaiB/BaiF CoA transferase family protein n=1 Tax=Mesorhizobium sp. 1B3 TaxID=3243599 RepID=UPI003D953D34
MSVLSSFTSLRVVEFAEGVAGPAAGMLLADLGADVVKVETPDGDRSREWGLPLEGGDAAIFHHLNRGKRSIVLDLTDTEDTAVFDRLVAAADVLIAHDDQGAPSGIDWRGIARLYPRLVVCEIDDIGSQGRFAGLPGSELTIQAMSGFTRYVGDRDGPPCRVGFEISGQAAAMHAYQGIVAALIEREASRKGQHLSVSTLGALLSMKTILLAAQSGDTDDWSGFHLNGPRWPADTGWDASDGQVTFDFRHGQRDAWAKFCEAIDLGRLVDDPEYEDWRSTIYLGDRRFTHGGPYREVFSRMTCAEISKLINEHDGISVKFQNYAEVLNHEQVRILEPLVEVEGGPEPARSQIGIPFRFGDEPRREVYASAPRLGEHRSAILAELNRSPRPVAAAAS